MKKLILFAAMACTAFIFNSSAVFAESLVTGGITSQQITVGKSTLTIELDYSYNKELVRKYAELEPRNYEGIAFETLRISVQQVDRKTYQQKSEYARVLSNVICAHSSEIFDHQHTCPITFTLTVKDPRDPGYPFIMTSQSGNFVPANVKAAALVY